MIALCTGTPSVKAQGDHMIATIPSGEGVVQIALTPHQAMRLGHALRSAAADKMEAARTAEVVAFPTKDVLSLAKRERRIREIMDSAKVLATMSPSP